MQTKQKIREYLAKKRQASGKELADFLGITDRAVRKQLVSLMERGEVAKKGLPPKVYYFLADGTEKSQNHEIDKRLTDLVEKNYLIITPSGERMDGVKGRMFVLISGYLKMKRWNKNWMAFLLLSTKTA